MIYLHQNEVNSVNIPLKDIQSGTNSYTFLIKDTQTFESTIFHCDDSRSGNLFYAGFTISCTQSIADLDNGIINNPVGYYDLWIYNMGATPSLNIDTGRLVYSDILEIQGDPQVIINNEINIQYKINRIE